MSVSKIFSFIFGIFGTALMLLTVLLSLTSLDGEVIMPQVPAEAVTCTEQFMEALADGDYATADKYLYGGSTLGEPREAAGEAGQQVWRAYADSFRYEFSGECYGEGEGICRDVTITSLDIPSVSDALQARAKVILDKRIADAQEVNNLTLVYEEDGSIRENILDLVVENAIAQAAAEDGKTVTTTVKLELVNAEGTWQILASTDLLKALSGGL